MTLERKKDTRNLLVTPRVPKGFQDMLPEDAILRNQVIDTIRHVFEKFGFLPIETPAFEYLDSLLGTGGDETNKQIFRLKSPEEEDMGLRFDLTVPFARLIAQYREELNLPFRRYHIAPVWRADKPGPGRFREFTQFDFDACGSADVAVDAEMVRALCDVMEALKVSDYVVNINDRKIVDAVLYASGVTDEAQIKHVLRVIDKLERVGIEEVLKELGQGRVDKSGDPIKGVGLDLTTIKSLERFLRVKGNTRMAVVENVRKIIPDTEKSKEALSEIERLVEALASLGVEEKYGRFTPTLARGLDYYTGPVYETMLPKALEFGSIMGGGRYDGLVKRYLGIDIPATGASIGIDRFIAALKHIKAVSAIKTTTKVFITVMIPDQILHYLSIATDLRGAGIATEVFFGKKGETLSKQLSLANSRGIPVAIIIGEDEMKRDQVSIKDFQVGMKKRKDITDHKIYKAEGKVGQITVPRSDCIAAVQKMLKNRGLK